MELYHYMYYVVLLLLACKTGLTVDSTVKDPAGQIAQLTPLANVVQSKTDTESKPPIQPEKQVTEKAPDQEKQQAENQSVKTVIPVQPDKSVQPRNEKHPDKSKPAGNEKYPQKQRRSETKDKNTKKCKPTEVLTANKGCVNRELYMHQILQRAWADENLDEAKDKAGLARSIECPDGQVQTPTGCAPQRKYLLGNDERVPVLPSHLHGERVYAAAGYLPALFENSEETNIYRAGPIGKPNRNTVQGTNNDNPVGHKTRHKYIYLPGRLLRSGRACRPYEVLGIKNRCIRKLGKVGLYKHKSHVYGHK
ncbi:uncharacterized protein [Drosophila virilis]|uniref:Uncharacterized protein n=1 Tax=Drosophila virilis TaxID=7244 RepID=B4LXV4_DROVI|nr:uncharacterized protein LOC6630499 [Drosophila virilis]EDW67913.1 uncharacterized protein Dvir_GJ24426 [Drosophila virilis]